MTDESIRDDAVGLERVTATLRHVPSIRHDAVDRVMSAALTAERDRRRRPTTWALRAAAIVVAAGVGAGSVWYLRAGVPAAPIVATASTAERGPASDGAAFAGATSGDVAPVPVAFTLRRAGAVRVAVVGDFDEWSPTAVPMTRDEGGTWTATVPLVPGRHAYAFVVDDTVWVTDPRAPLERDADYGRHHSIIVVGRP